MDFHTQVVRQMFIRSGEINERIVAGDICSAKTGLPLARKLCEAFTSTLGSCGCQEISIDPFVAYGGWIGITYSYNFRGQDFSGSAVVRSLS